MKDSPEQKTRMTPYRAGAMALALMLITTAPARADFTGDYAAFAGDWITPAGATVRIEPCGESPCGRIVRFTPPPGRSMVNTRDRNNHDESKRGRRILGLAVLYELRPAGHHLKGRVYDPRRGFSADATVTPTGNNRLTVKGCVRVLFNICEKEVWRRAR